MWEYAQGMIAIFMQNVSKGCTQMTSMHKAARLRNVAFLGLDAHRTNYLSSRDPHTQASTTRFYPDLPPTRPEWLPSRMKTRLLLVLFKVAEWMNQPWLCEEAYRWSQQVGATTAHLYCTQRASMRISNKHHLRFYGDQPYNYWGVVSVIDRTLFRRTRLNHLDESPRRWL